MTDPPEDDDPDAGLEWTGKGMESTGLFALDAGTVQARPLLAGRSFGRPAR